MSFTGIMYQDEKIVVVEDRKYLFPLSVEGPVLHPMKLKNEKIGDLFTKANARFVFALNPKDYAQRVLLNEENYLTTNGVLFGEDFEFEPTSEMVAQAVIGSTQEADEQESQIQEADEQAPVEAGEPEIQTQETEITGDAQTEQNQEADEQAPVEAGESEIQTQETEQNQEADEQETQTEQAPVEAVTAPVEEVKSAPATGKVKKR